MEHSNLDAPTALHYLLEEDCQRVQGLEEKNMQKKREMNVESSRLEGYWPVLVLLRCRSVNSSLDQNLWIRIELSSNQVLALI